MSNTRSKDDERDDQRPYFSIWWRFGFGAVFFAILGFVVWRYVAYVLEPIKELAPSELQLPLLLSISCAGLFLVVFPLEKMGLRIKRIGPLELEQIVKIQAQEKTEAMGQIDKRLSLLEDRLRAKSETGKVVDEVNRPDIQPILKNFFLTYRKAISPHLLETWGAEQPGFDELKKVDSAMIRRSLRELVADGILETTLSKKGNTLYRLADQ